MTPRRKTALRKAQLASARKRRHGRASRAGRIVGVTLVAAAASGGTYYAGKHFYTKHDNKKKYNAWATVVKQNAMLQLPAGKSTVRGPSDTDKRIKEFDRSARRAASRIKAAKTAKKRAQQKRMKYWAGKPVSGKAAIPAISTAGSRRAGTKRRKR